MQTTRILNQTEPQDGEWWILAKVAEEIVWVNHILLTSNCLWRLHRMHPVGAATLLMLEVRGELRQTRLSVSVCKACQPQSRRAKALSYLREPRKDKALLFNISNALWQSLDASLPGYCGFMLHTTWILLPILVWGGFISLHDLSELFMIHNP